MVEIICPISQNYYSNCDKNDDFSKIVKNKSERDEEHNFWRIKNYALVGKIVRPMQRLQNLSLQISLCWQVKSISQKSFFWSGRII